MPMPIVPVMTHARIAASFNARFGRRATLIGGAREPLYLPPAPARPAIIRYTHDYAQSALHEIAHWCLASPGRRARVDYGMWYLPPPRSAQDQARFFAVEVPVQALGMLLAEACGVPFHFSVDNPGVDDPASEADFEMKVRQAYSALRSEGPGDLALAVLQALNPGAWAGTAPRPRDGDS
jgi:elongation factor P hydroxylase